MALKIYEKFAPRANVGDTNYPNGSIKNESVPGAKDGTPLDATWGNDYAGFDAALFAEAATIPSGSADTALVSQRLDALHSIFDVYGTVAELAAGKFEVDKRVAVTDRDGKIFLIQSGGTTNGNSIIPAGGTNTAVRVASKSNNTSVSMGATPVASDSATNAAIEYLYAVDTDATGGIVNLPPFESTLTDSLLIDSTAPFNVDSISLVGAGRQTTYMVADGAFGAGVNIKVPTYVNLLDFGIRGCSGDGIKFDDDGGSAGNRNNIERVQSSFNLGNGFNFQRSFMTNVSSTEARQNGASGYFWDSSVHTSWNINNNYSLLNTGPGFRTEYLVYSSFVANGSDDNQYGYQILGARGVSFVSNGAEFNKRAGWYFQSNATRPVNYVSMTANLAVDNNKQNAGFANHTQLSAADSKGNSVFQYQPVSLLATTASTKDFISSGRGSVLVLTDPLMENSGPQGLNDGFLQINYSVPKLIYEKPFTATSTAKITSVRNQNGLFADYSGELLITCSNAAFGSGGVIGTSTYKLLVSKSLAGVEVLEIAKVGLVNGANATHPSFIFTIDGTANELNATAQNLTAGSFWFAVEKLSGNIIFT